LFSAFGLKEKSAKAKSIISLVLAILAVVVAIGVRTFSYIKLYGYFSDIFHFEVYNSEASSEETAKTQKILEQYLDADLSEFKVDEDEVVLRGEAVLTLTNKSKKRHSFYVFVEAVDENGTTIGYDPVFVESLKSGQTKRFRVFEKIGTENVEQYKNVKLKITKASMY
ncbi:MAG: hypothetical protein K5917_00260, partial [Clostridiales bacterium]|nr:hypothetical protein [Clostridiales bacterium]